VCGRLLESTAEYPDELRQPAPAGGKLGP
jgi:hypothetical protein